MSAKRTLLKLLAMVCNVYANPKELQQTAMLDTICKG